MSYVYKNPLDSGYRQFKLTKRQHNKLFTNRKKTWKNRFEYYYNDKEFIMHKFVSVPVVILMTIAFPIMILIMGIINIKETLYDYKRLYNQKKYGSFSGDSAWAGTDKYKEIMNVIGGN